MDNLSETLTQNRKQSKERSGAEEAWWKSACLVCVKKEVQDPHYKPENAEKGAGEEGQERLG